MEKRIKVMQGERVVMSDAEIDAWVADGMPSNVASVPNSTRCGILDAWIVFAK